VAWGVLPADYDRAMNFIQSLDNETRDFFLSKGMTMPQMVLERLFITLAQIYSADRANRYDF
jgi:hypothetical protein